jgi:thymidine kinase
MKNNYRVDNDLVYVETESKTHGFHEFIIDHFDFHLVDNYNGVWRTEKVKNTDDQYYIVGHRANGEKNIKLHRFIIGEDNLEYDDVVDHCDGDKLNNSRNNLRVCKQKLNSQNLSGDRKNSTTKLRGVSKRKKDGKFEAYFTLNYTRYNLGIFDTLEEADEVSTIARAMFMPYSEQDMQKFGYMNEDKKGVIYFRHGVMGAGKSAMLLKSLYVYDRMGKSYLLLTSKRDNRYDIGYITSRNGNSRKAIAIDKLDNILDGLKWHNYNLDYIIIDEWHLFDEKHIKEIVEVSLRHNITVICYGLMIDYRGNMFETTRRLIEVSSSIQQIPYNCECGNLATHHLLSLNGEYIFDGDGIFVGDQEYSSVCYECFHEHKHNK